ncbi:DUF5702 domain-containing protein [Carnobacterium gallinarum]|uniref:DUF5702 domain-containing protein n=1 Tax=Carnobacterium gallinarum TaxID=2749 RepID=UPI00055263B7|nr:DUF5702 domain-containing protein [Carnobacterium gallinarum]
MENFFRRQNGSVSIYFMIVSLIFFLFSTVLIDFMRIMVAERKLEHATKTAAASIMSNYNAEVMGRYGLFVFDGDTSKATEMASNVTKSNLELKDNFFNIAELSNSTSQVDFMKFDDRIGLTSEETLKQQMLESVKYKGPLAFGEETFEIFDFFTQNGRDTQALKKMMKEQKKIKAEMEKRLENIKEIEEELKNIEIAPIQLSLNRSQIEAYNQAIFIKTYFVESGDSFENKQQAIFKQAYENETDEKIKANLKIQMDKHHEELEKLKDAGTDAETSLGNEVTNINAKVTEVKNALSKLKTAESAIKAAITSNEEIKKKLGNLPSGDSKEINEMREAIQKAYVDPVKLTDMQGKIQTSKKNLETYQGKLEAYSKKIKGYKKASLKPGIDKSLAIDKNDLKIDQDSTKEQIEQSVTNRVTKNKNHAMAVGYQSVVDLYLGKEISAIENSGINEINQAIDAVVTTSKEKEVRQELSEDEKKQEEAEKEKTAGGMKDLGKIMDVINTAKDKLDSEQAIYDNLEAIMKSNDAENQKDYPEGKAPSTDADDLVDQSFDLLDTLTTMGNQLKNRALLNEYLLGEFGTSQPVSLFGTDTIDPDNIDGLISDFEFQNKQVEYLMYGKSTPGANYASALLELIMIRLVCNLISGAFDKAVQKAFSVNILVGLAALISYTIIETVKDIIKLTKSNDIERKDKSAAFFKMKIGKIDPSKLTLTYRDYLRLMLLFERKNQYARALAVVEQVSEEKGVGIKPTQIKVTNTAKIKPWFLPNAVKTFTTLDSKLVDGEIELKTELYYSY